MKLDYKGKRKYYNFVFEIVKLFLWNLRLFLPNCGPNTKWTVEGDISLKKRKVWFRDVCVFFSCVHFESAHFVKALLSQFTCHSSCFFFLKETEDTKSFTVFEKQLTSFFTVTRLATLNGADKMLLTLHVKTKPHEFLIKLQELWADLLLITLESLLFIFQWESVKITVRNLWSFSLLCRFYIKSTSPLWKWDQKMFRWQIILKESVSPHERTESNPSLIQLWLTFILSFLCSLLPHRQHRGDAGGSGVCRHPWVHHSFHQEGSDHWAALCLPAGVPGLPDRRALLPVCHPVVSLPT